jgi:hypothetical protein
MSDTENWVAQQEHNSLFRGKDVRQLARLMLEMSPTNRIVTERTSKLAIACLLLNKRLGHEWDWLGDIVRTSEEYQLTIGIGKNSRDAFADVIQKSVPRVASRRRLSTENTDGYDEPY